GDRICYFQNVFGNFFKRFRKTPAKASILVAEDQADVAGLVSDILTAEGYQVECVGDGAEALKRLKKKRFDLLILDVHMPNMGGPEALELIRRAPGGADL